MSATVENVAFITSGGIAGTCTSLPPLAMNHDGSLQELQPTRLYTYRQVPNGAPPGHYLDIFTVQTLIALALLSCLLPN